MDQDLPQNGLINLNGANKLCAPVVSILFSAVGELGRIMYESSSGFARLILILRDEVHLKEMTSLVQDRPMAQ